MRLVLLLLWLLAPAAVDTVSVSGSGTASLSPSRSPSASRCASATRSPSASPRGTPTVLTPTPTACASQSRSASRSPSTTACPSRTRSPSPCGSATRAPSASGGASASLAPSRSPSPCTSASPSASPCASASGSPTRSRSASPCACGSGSPSRSRSATLSPSASPSRSASPSPSPSPSESGCASGTLSVTQTVSGSATATTTAAARPVWPGFHAGAARTGSTDIAAVPRHVRQQWAATRAAAPPPPPPSGNSSSGAGRLSRTVNAAAAMGAVVSSPAVGRNGHIFIGSNDGHLYSFFTNGTLRWAAALEGYVTASPAVSPLDFGVVVGDRAGMLYKFSDASGALLWGVQACSRGPAPDPLATAAGAAFATSPTGFGAGIASSAAIDALGTVYIGCLDGRVRALSSGGGSVLWSVGTGGGIVSSPGLRSEGAGAAWGGGTLYLYVASLDGCLHALLARDGSARWGCFSAGAPLTSSPALPSGELAGGEDGAVGDTVYLTTTHGRALAVWGGNGTLRWEFAGFGRALAAAAGGQLAPLTPTPAYARNCSALYVGGWDGGVWALSPTTGAPLWNFSTPAVLSASPALGYSEGTCGLDYRRAGFAARGDGAAAAGAAGGLPPAPLWPTCTCFLYTAGEDGWVRAFNGSSGEQVWVFKGALGPIRSSPAIDATGSVVFGAANVLGSAGAVYKLEEGLPSVSASASGSPTASPTHVPVSASATGSARASRSTSGSPSDSFSPAPSLNTSATPSQPAHTRSPSPCPSPRASPPATPSPPGAATRAPSRLPSRSPSPSPTLLTPLPTPSATVSRWVSPSTHPWPCAGGNAARTNAAPSSGAGSAIAALAPQRMFNPGSDAPGVLWTLHLGGPLRSPPTLHSLGWVLVGVDAPGCGGGGGLAVVDGVRGVLLWCVPSLGGGGGGGGGSGVRGGAALSAVNASFPALGEDKAYIGLNGGLSAVLLAGAGAGGGGGAGGGVAWAYSSPELCGWDAGSSGGSGSARAAPLGPSSASPAYTYASPVLIGGATVVATCSDAASGSLAVGLDARSGRLQWSHSLPPGSALTTTPAFSAALNLTYLSYVLGGGEGSGASAATSLLRVRAVHAGNGSTAWDAAVSGGSGGGGGTAPPAAPLLVAPNNLLLLPVAFTTLAALDARSGAGVWAWSAPPGDLPAAPGSLPTDARLAPWPALCPASGAAYFPAGAVLYKLAGSGGGGGAWASPAAPPPLLWSFATGAALVAPPTLAFDGATVVQPSSDGYLYALRAGSGALAWRLPGAGWTPAAPGANGVLYLGSLAGTLQAVGALATRSPTASPSLSATPSASATYSRASPSATPSASASASPSLSPASTATLSPPLSVSGSGSHSGSPAPSRQPSRSVSASASPRQSQSEAVVSSAPVSPSNNCPTNTRNFRVNLGLSGAGGGAWGGARGAWLCACALGAASLALLLGS